jgi:hypothetical protein
VIVLAVLVPDNREGMTTADNAIETEVIPLAIGYQWIYYNTAVCLGPESADTRYHQVVERRVVIVAATFAVAHKPGTICLVKILANIGSATMMLTLDV